MESATGKESPDEFRKMVMRNYIRNYRTWIGKGVDINGNHPTIEDAARYAQICNMLREMGENTDS